MLGAIEQHKRAGSKGGKKVARLYGAAFKQTRAQKGGLSCLTKDGRAYYRAIRMRRGK